MSKYNFTPQEAIAVIKNNWPDSRYTILSEALEMAVEALKKQTEKEPVGRNNKCCPECGLMFIRKVGYCGQCGQKIDWSEV